jgi:hypothetical protein
VLFAALLGLVVATALWPILERRLELDATASAISRGIVVALLAILVAYAFGSALFQRQLWVLLGVTAAIPTLVPSPPDGVSPRDARVHR